MSAVTIYRHPDGEGSIQFDAESYRLSLINDAKGLTRLLSGEVITAADTLSDAATMRAAAHVNYLKKDYGWPIEAEARAVACTDGRVATVAAYKLPADCIQAARAAGATGWIAEVKAARAAQRAKAPDAYRRAAKMNKAHERPAAHPGQLGLFKEGME